MYTFFGAVTIPDRRRNEWMDRHDDKNDGKNDCDSDDKDKEENDDDEDGDEDEHLGSSKKCTEKQKTAMRKESQESKRQR